MRKYSEAVKLKAVFEVETCELSHKGAARKYGCDPASIRGWVRKYGNEKWRHRMKEAMMGEDAAAKRIKELERQLKKAQICVDIYEKMFELARDEYGIDLKKNYNIEPSEPGEEKLPSGKAAKRGS